MMFQYDQGLLEHVLREHPQELVVWTPSSGPTAAPAAATGSTATSGGLIAAVAVPPDTAMAGGLSVAAAADPLTSSAPAQDAQSASPCSSTKSAGFLRCFDDSNSLPSLPPKELLHLIQRAGRQQLRGKQRHRWSDEAPFG